MTNPDGITYRITTEPSELRAAAELVSTLLVSTDPAGVKGWFSVAYAGERTAVYAAAFDSDHEMIGAMMSRRYDSLRQLGLGPEHLELFSSLQYAAVDRRWQRRGVGKALVNLTLPRLQDLGVRCWLGGAETADAAHFFGSCGFSVEPLGANLALFGEHGPELRSKRPGYRWFHRLV